MHYRLDIRLKLTGKGSGEARAVAPPPTIK
jgi:hypothetical protein